MSNTDLVEDDFSCNDLSSHGSDYMFGFNDHRFSDRVLVIEILADDASYQSQISDLRSAENGVGGDDSSQECSRVTELHVNSIILAAKSPFFRNLFINGMMESEQRCVTLRIHASEEPAFTELMNYMYSGRLSSRNATVLLQVIKLADKFQVVSCMRLCTRLLAKLPMTTESALVFLDLTSSLPMADEDHHLADAAKQFLGDRYKDIDEVWDEIMALPLAGIEAILSSDVLQVSSEDRVFSFAMKWAETHYPKPEDQRKILSAHLGRYIRFPYMSPEKLREVLSCDLLDDDFARKVVVDALFFKMKTPRRHLYRKTESEESSTSSTNHRPRAYRPNPIDMTVVELPLQNLVAYLDIMFDECANLEPSEYLYSQPFNFCGHTFYLYASCIEEDTYSTYFCVCLEAKLLKYLPLEVEFDVSYMSRSKKNFVCKNSSSVIFTGADAGGSTLYWTPWDDFKAGGGDLDCSHGILSFEVRLRIMQ